MHRLLLLLTLTAPGAALAQSLFHGDPAHTGVFAGAGPKQLPKVKWAFKAGGPIVTSPSIADGVVYVGAWDGHLHAIDQATGTEQWKFKSRQPIASTAAIADGLVYFVSSVGSLAALDAKTGEPRWVLPTEYERKFEAKNLHGYSPAAQTIPDAWDVFLSSPTVVGGKVYFGSGDGNVYAADAKTGLLLWKFTTGGVVHSSPAVVAGVVYIGSWDSNLYAIDAETGQQRWVFHALQDETIHNQVGFQSSPTVVDGTLYIGCRDAHVYAIDAANGRKKWDYPTSKGWVISTPAVSGGLVFVGTSDGTRFIGLDAKTGRLKLNLDLKANIFSSPAYADGFVYVGSHNGRLYAIDIARQAIAWEFQTAASLANARKLLTPEGRFDRQAFAPVFHDFQDMYLDFANYVSVGGIMSSPTVDRGVVYVGSLDGTLYALE